MEFQEVSNLCLLDLRTAFDTLDHNILLSKLDLKFGLQDTALQWFDSYLHPRYCIVQVEESYSSSRSLNVSVSQGSMDEPKLF